MPNTILKLVVSTLICAFFLACGSTPTKDVDRDGLRQRADEETSQVK